MTSQVTGIHAGIGARAAMRTTMLMAVLVAVLATGGWVFGGRSGLTLFAAVGVLVNLGTYWFSDRLALMAHRARPIARAEAPGLHEIVGRLSEQANMPAPPIYVIPSRSPNAFATGRGPRHAAVAVTEGLLEIMDERELEGVLAHELSHVRNRDVLIATIAASIAGIISSIGYVLRWGLLLGGAGGRREERGSALSAVVWIIVAPIIAVLLQLAIGRTREYGADASGARLSGDPGGLADALEKLEAWSARRPYEFAGPATAHLFIVNPLRGAAARFLNLLSTHPPIEARVARLRAMRV
jgi:heat shock protein HtpX